jgi:pyruvate carboxylase
MAPLLQVICHDGTYLKAIQRMQRALFEFHIRGIKTNIGGALYLFASPGLFVSPGMPCPSPQ